MTSKNADMTYNEITCKLEYFNLKGSLNKMETNWDGKISFKTQLVNFFDTICIYAIYNEKYKEPVTFGLAEGYETRVFHSLFLDRPVHAGK